MNLTKVKKRLKRFVRVAVILGLLICMIFAVASTRQLNQSIDLGNRKIVLNYGNQVAARIHDLFERVDISLANLSGEIAVLGDTSGDALKRRLDYYQTVWEMDAAGWLYEEGASSLSDGSAVEFENEISLQDVLSYSDKLNISRQSINGEDMLVFAKPCKTKVEGRSTGGVFSAMKMERLESFLGDYGYSSDSFMVLTQSNGDNIWKQGAEQNISAANCFVELEEYQVREGDSIRQMQTRMTVNMDGTIVYAHGEQEYYMAYVPLGVNYWYLLVSVRSDSIDLTELARQHFIISSLLVCGILMLGAICIVYLFQRNRSISRYNQQLRIANEANEANRAKQEFLAKVSHDIRTPLNGVMGMLMLAKEEYSDQEKCFEYLDKASVSAHFLLGLLNDVLDMSQIESGKQRLVEATVDMKELLEEIEAIVETSAGEKGLSFRIEAAALKHRYFLGDQLRLKQILMNLCSNAVKYTATGGWIALSVEETRSDGATQLIFRVQDNGEGIAEDKLETIFKPFEQVSTRQQGGVGLGLSIVRSFVEMMKGQISVESKLGEGSTFKVIVPLEVTEPPKSVLEKENPVDLHGISVLLAEDNKVNAQIIIYLLEKRGANVKHVWNGEEAVEEFRQNPAGTYHIILMDIQMPKMNGIEATQLIRQLDRTDAAQIPIVSMTANAFHEQKEEMLQAGMNDFLYKPIEIEAVCSCILKWVKEEA